jgi:hypothetical protein
MSGGWGRRRLQPLGSIKAPSLRDGVKPDFVSALPAMELKAFVLRRSRKPLTLSLRAVDVRGFAVRRRGG